VKARGRSGQQQYRNVRARNQQDEADADGEHDEGRPRSTKDVLVKRSQHRFHTRAKFAAGAARDQPR
jgi:hypothetical protein